MSDGEQFQLVITYFKPSDSSSQEIRNELTARGIQFNEDPVEVIHYDKNESHHLNDRIVIKNTTKSTMLELLTWIAGKAKTMFSNPVEFKIVKNNDGESIEYYAKGATLAEFERMVELANSSGKQKSKPETVKPEKPTQNE